MQSLTRHIRGTQLPVLVAGLFLFCFSLSAQRGRVPHSKDVVRTVQDNQLELESEDSCTVINLIESYIRPQLRKQIWQDIDTTKYYIYQAMAIAQRINYIQGIHDLRRCLGSAYTAKGPQDSAQFYLRYSIKEMGDKRDTPRINKFLMEYGRSCWLSSKFDSAIYVTEKAAKNALIINDSSAYLDYVSYLPKFYVESGDYVKGAKLSSQNMELAIQIKDTSNVVVNARYLAKVYSHMGLHDREMEAAKTALRFGGSANNIYTNFHAYLAISEAYYHHHQYDSAIFYAWKNISYGGGQNLSDLTLGTVYRDQGLLDSAIFHIQNFIDVTIKFKLHNWPEPYFLLGSCEFIKGHFREAVKNYHKAEAELKPQDMLVFREIYKSLAACYDTLDQPDKALYYLDLFIVLEDSMDMNQKSFAIAMIESEKDAGEMKGQIHWLTENNQLQKALTNKEKQHKNMVYGGAVSLLALSVLAFIRFRKQKEMKSKQSILKERLRISRELHDEVGSTLSGIAMYSHVAKEQIKNLENILAENSLTLMQKSAGEMVSKLSDIVWLINPEQDTISELFERLVEYARIMASVKNMRVIVDLPPGLSAIHIPLEDRRNIYLFCKEAINNAVKYSYGSYIEIQAKTAGDKIRFSVKDDGHGFDETTIRRGNGLENMRKRAEAIGATFVIGTRPQQGVNIEMQYKLIQ